MLSKVQKIALSLGIGICLVASMLFVCNMQQHVSATIVKKQALANISDKLVIHLPIEQDSPNSYGYAPFAESRMKEALAAAQNKLSLCPIYLPDAFNQSLIINSEIDLETSIIGTNDKFDAVSGLSMEQGSFFTPKQIDEGEKVCVVSNAVLNYFGLDASAASVQLNGESYKIVGVFTLAPMAGNASSTFNIAPDNERLILMPYTALNNNSNNEQQINYIMAKPSEQINQNKLADFANKLSNKLKAEATNKESPLIAAPLYKIIQTLEKDNVGAIIAAIALLSTILLVLAGLNLMQMTKAAVYDNQRAIAIKMAIGASPAAICKELFKELAIVCAKASYFGLVATALVVMALNQYQGTRLLSFDFLSMLIGLGGVCCMLFISVAMPFRAIVKLPITAALGTQREGG